VFALAELIDQRYSALVLLGTFGSLRLAELATLRRKDIDLTAGTVRVEWQLTELPGRGYRYGPPKSEASQRTVPIPDLIVPRSDRTSMPSLARTMMRPSSRARLACRYGMVISVAASGSPH
jgi:integrase